MRRVPPNLGRPRLASPRGVVARVPRPDLGLHLAGRADGTADGFVRRGDEPARETTRVRREASTTAARIVVDDQLEIEVDVLMDAPVPIDEHVFIDRALCRVRAGDAIETGWSSEVAKR